MSTRYPGGIHEAAALSWWNMWNEARSALSAALQLSALGVLIEIADRIRVNSERRAGPYVLINIVFLVMGNLHPAALPQDFLLQLVQSTIYVVVLFGAAATLIELVDQIRWNALPPDQRVKL